MPWSGGKDVSRFSKFFFAVLIAVGDKMAVAVRFSAETNAHIPGGDGNPIPGETEEILGSLGELPDLWDININDYSLEMGLSRFTKEAALTPYVKGIKKLTSKPVVTVGRFTSPDTMLAQIKDGIVDLIFHLLLVHLIL